METGGLAVRRKTYTATTVFVVVVGLLPIRERDAAGVLPRRQHPPHQTPPTIVTTDRGPPDWGQIFGDPVVAAAIQDRLLHNAVVFNIKAHPGGYVNTTSSPPPPPTPT